MPSAAPRKSAMTLLAISMLTLSGCATKTGSGEKTDVSALLFCDGAKPITWSAKDTDGTLKQVRAHNAVGKSECKWGR